MRNFLIHWLVSRAHSWNKNENLQANHAHTNRHTSKKHRGRGESSVPPFPDEVTRLDPAWTFLEQDIYLSWGWAGLRRSGRRAGWTLLPACSGSLWASWSSSALVQSKFLNPVYSVSPSDYVASKLHIKALTPDIRAFGILCEAKSGMFWCRIGFRSDDLYMVIYVRLSYCRLMNFDFSVITAITVDTNNRKCVKSNTLLLLKEETTKTSSWYFAFVKVVHGSNAWVKVLNYLILNVPKYQKYKQNWCIRTSTCRCSIIWVNRLPYLIFIFFLYICFRFLCLFVFKCIWSCIKYRKIKS